MFPAISRFGGHRRSASLGDANPIGIFTIRVGTSLRVQSRSIRDREFNIDARQEASDKSVPRKLPDAIRGTAVVPIPTRAPDCFFRSSSEAVPRKFAETFRGTTSVDDGVSFIIIAGPRLSEVVVATFAKKKTSSTLFCLSFLSDRAISVWRKQAEAMRPSEMKLAPEAIMNPFEEQSPSTMRYGLFSLQDRNLS